MSKATEELLDQLHGLVAKDLIDKIKSGEATAQDLGAAIRFLKENNVQADPTENKNLGELYETVTAVEDLPFTVGEE
ncbi:MAG: hypothetical protein Unbinned200contig1002_19 [Prokaryotic dsDNA virus sp.]|jgi:hypothetical protein|nr:hypothetical protein [Flavobacteriaceae bacterium]QDP68318.1 MAG: hypothetical protein Unbinned200contig1002_19 [Prokaryotic dsDNA virus sp.]|tara:strand:- start:7602 stop:7832 length:231 start_codon:yes stop_codon:yes gene_type:complete